MAYIQSPKKEDECIFCAGLDHPDSPDNLIVRRGQRAYVILNRYPYTSGHLMIVPYAHLATLGGLDAETRAELMELVNEAIHVLDAVYIPEGYNVGLNIGESAGAGVRGHVHMHVVPRWGGDTNFMSSLGDTRVLPESLEQTYARVSQAWGSLYKKTE